MNRLVQFPNYPTDDKKQRQ